MRAKLTLCTLVLTSLLSACQLDESPRKNDLVVKNGGTATLGKVLCNGVDQGALPPAGVLTLEDVGSGAIVVQAFRKPDDVVPCATYETPGLRGGEILHHTFDCSR